MLLHEGAVALTPGDIAVPSIARDEILVRVSVCAVCRTDLDLVEQRIQPSMYPVVPGHQVIGAVAAVGADVRQFKQADRVGVAWINSACGVCQWCRSGNENLCPAFRATGCDAHGGYAEYLAVRAAFAHPIPDQLSDLRAAPLLCAGAIGWRALRLAKLRSGEALGLTGFGASAHLVLQLAQHLYPQSPVYVFARDSAERSFALELGATWAGDTEAAPPSGMTAVIDTTPAWKPLVAALRHLLPGGRVVVNAIRKLTSDQSELLRLDYAADLWLEREIKSVANVTRADVREMLALAAPANLQVTISEQPLEAANHALATLRAGSIRGATVLRVA